MKKLNVIFTTFLFLTANYLLLATNSYAQYGQYGGPSPSLAILIDKMVAKPNTNTDFVDNLSSSDPRFVPSQDVFFKLKVKNTSNVILKNVNVTDFAPPYLDPIEGVGTYNASNRTITFNAGDFQPGEEKVYTLKMRVQGQNTLPADKGLFCVVNKARAETEPFDANNLNPSITPQPTDPADEDTAQLCIEKQVTQITPGVSKVPSAGPELGLILLAGQFVTLGAGLYIRKRSK